MSPKAIELRLLICSIVYWAYCVRFCLIDTAFVEGVTLGVSSFVIESKYLVIYSYSEGQEASSNGS